MLSYWNAGNRSSVDASQLGGAGAEEDETVVEGEQGNGECAVYFLKRAWRGMGMGRES